MIKKSEKLSKIFWDASLEHFEASARFLQVKTLVSKDSVTFAEEKQLI